MIAAPRLKRAPPSISDFPAGFGNDLCQASGCREQRNEARLQGVINVALAGEERVGGDQVFRQLLMPAAIPVVDEGTTDGAPDLAVARLMEIARQMLVEIVRSAGAFGCRPPELVALGRHVGPI